MLLDDMKLKCVESAKRWCCTLMEPVKDVDIKKEATKKEQLEKILPKWYKDNPKLRKKFSIHFECLVIYVNKEGHELGESDIFWRLTKRVQPISKEKKESKNS